MEKVFFFADGRQVLLGVNEALRYAIDNGLDVFMVRYFDHRLKLEDQLLKEEMNLMRILPYNCSICKKPCIEYTMYVRAGNDDITCTSSGCGKESFLKQANSMKGVGFANSPDDGAQFE
jgi:hypothetical protein